MRTFGVEIKMRIGTAEEVAALAAVYLTLLLLQQYIYTSTIRISLFIYVAP